MEKVIDKDYQIVIQAIKKTAAMGELLSKTAKLKERLDKGDHIIDSRDPDRVWYIRADKDIYDKPEFWNLEYHY